MKKISLLALALIVSLPGCCNRKKEACCPTKKNNVEKYIETSGEVVDDLDDLDLDALDEEEDENPEDAEDLDFDEEDIAPADGEEDEDESADQDEKYSWIDAQTDDEFKKLYFAFNHYGIKADQKDAAAYDIEQVKQLIAESATAAQPTVVIEGHACQEGTPAYNLALSEKRAKNIADLFVAAGVDRSVIKVVGRGSECPVVVDGKVANGSREERAPNRRVEVRVIYT